MMRRVNVPSLSPLSWTLLSLTLFGITARAQSPNPILARSANPLRLVAAPSFPLSASPTSVAVGDVNGDGRPDLVITKVGSSNITVLLGDGKGGFEAGTDFPAGSQPANALLADLNGDGRLDVVVTDAHAGAIDVLFGNGDGTLGAPIAYPAIADPIGIALGNFNTHGKVDLAVTSATGLALLVNDSSGHFATAASIPISRQARSLTSADLSHKGHDDLVLANQDGTISVLQGDGSGHFSALPAFSVATGPLSSVVAGDFGKRGRIDLAVTQANSNTLTVLLGNGNGTFQPGVPYTVGNRPASLIVADLNNNGVSDLIAVNQAANTFSVLAGNGDGTFRPSLDFVAGNAPVAVASGDFDGDGHADLAIVNYQDRTVTVPRGRGDGIFQAPRSYRAGLSRKAIAAGDLNGDGLPDLVVTNYCGSDYACTSGGNASVFLANQNGAYRLAGSYSLGSGPVAVALASLHGNKTQDLLALNRDDKTLMVMSGNGDGTFAEPQHYLLSANPRALFVGDFNGDGTPDLAIASDCGRSLCAQPGSLDIWLGSGNGNLTEAAIYTVGYSPTSIAAGDLRGTGHLDLVIANKCGEDSSCKADGTATVLNGDGTGKFTVTNEIGIGAMPSSIAIGNLSNRGLDLVVAQSASNRIAVLPSDGKGGFGAPVTYAVGSVPSSLAIADFDGDGLPDVAVANFQSSTVSLLSGTGNGALRPAITYPVGAGPESIVAVRAGSSGPSGLVTANGNGGATPMGADISTLAPTLTTPTITLTNSPSPANFVGEQITLTAVVALASPPPAPPQITGSVTFNTVDSSNNATPLSDCNGANGVTLSVASQANGGAPSGQAACTVNSLQPGTYTLEAIYSGDGGANYSAATSSTVSQSVTASTTTALTASPTSPAINQAVTFTATIKPPTGATVAPAGTVGFTDNGNALSCTPAYSTSNAVLTATCSISSLSGGSHTILAAYSGDTNYTASTGILSLSLTAAASTTTVSSSPNPSVFSQAVTFTVIVTPSSSGSQQLGGTVAVTAEGNLSLGQCALAWNQPAAGEASCTVSNTTLSVGSHTITATYSGDNNFKTSSGTTSQVVNAATTAVSLSSSAGAIIVKNPNNSNDSVTFTATVTPFNGNSKPSGTVTFTYNSGLIIPECPVAVQISSVNGTATCTTTSLPPGANTIQASFSGDKNFAASNSSLTEAVQDFSLTVSGPTIVSGSPRVTVTQGDTTGNDPFSPVTISAVPVSIQGFAGSLTLGCTVLVTAAPSGATVPLCIAGSTLPIVSNGTQQSVGIIIDATRATPGTYSVSVTGTDQATGLVRTATPFTVAIRTFSGPLTLTSGATTGNTANVTFVLPANVSLSSLQCSSVSGTGIGAPGVPSSTLSIGCSFNPATIPAQGSIQTGSTVVTVTTGGTGTAMGRVSHTGLLAAGLFGIPIFGLVGLLRGRKSTSVIFFRLLAIAAVYAAALQVSGCGYSLKKPATSGGQTPPGAYSIQIQGTGSDGLPYQAVLQINVTL